MGQTTEALPSASAAAPDGRSPRASLFALHVWVVAIAALYFGRELLVPIVLAALLAFVLAPLVTLLQRARLGNTGATLAAVGIALALLLSIGLVTGRQLTVLVQSLPTYQQTIHQKLGDLAARNSFLESLIGPLRDTIDEVLVKEPFRDTVFVWREEQATPPPPRVATPSPAPAPSMNPPASSSTTAAPPAAKPAGETTAATIARSVVVPLVGPLATLGLVAVFVIFILFAREDLRDRAVRLLGREDLHRTILAMNDATSRLSRFFLTQLLLNAGFGLFVALGLWIGGLPNPLLWGIIAGLMRFLPFIGIIVAVVPPVLLAFAVMPGWFLTLFVLGLFVVGEIAMGQIIEPLVYGQNTGLSPIAVILCISFWGFLWGPVGLLLGTPLTVCLVVLGRHVRQLAFLDIILGDTPPLKPSETFYQRALEGKGVVLLEQAGQGVAAQGLTEYYDQVALRGLALAQADLARDALAFERLEAIHAQIEDMLASLGNGAPVPAAGESAPLPPEWRRERAIVCMPARGQLDDLASAMAMQVLRGAGFGVETVSNLILGGGKELGEDFSATRLACLSVFEQGSNPSGVRYLLRRMQRQMPNASIVICLWHAAGDSEMLATLRAEGNTGAAEETIVLSLGELLAMARAISARAPRAVEAAVSAG